MKNLFIFLTLLLSFTAGAQRVVIKGKKAQVNPKTIYYNTQQSYTAHCPVGYTGDSVVVVVAARTYASYKSVSEANSLAVDAARIAAEDALDCNPPLYYNTFQTYTATCSTGTGTPVTVSKADSAYSSYISVADANSIALAAATQEAEAALVCTPTPTTYFNTEQSYTATCPSGTIGMPVTVTKTAGTYTSLVSVADANSKALAAATAEATAALSCVAIYYNTFQTYTASCPSGYSGAPVTVTKADSTYTSFTSVADANSKALAAATSEAQSQLTCSQIVYYNSAQTYVAKCPSGYSGDSVMVTKAAGTYTSIISQQDANAKALADAKTQAEASLSCTPIPTVYYNTQQSYTASCPSGTTGANVTVTKAAGTYSSLVSQLDANNKALSAAKAEAEANLSCTPIYTNTAQTYTANCPTGTTGNSVTVTIPAGQFTSTISQADANSKALAAAQQQATAQLSCQTTGFNLSSFPALSYATPGVSAPGEAFSMNAAGTASSSAPQIAEWTRSDGIKNTAKQISIVFTGENLSNPTSFYTVFDGGSLADATSITINGRVGSCRLPSNTFKFRVLWPENTSGKGSPITINRTNAEWATERVAAGMTARVFGKNLAQNGVPGTNNAYIYLKPTGGGSGTYATVTKVTPYCVEYTVPAVSAGTYQVWAHNGHGGDYGWSLCPTTITVLSANSHVLTRTWGNTFNVLNYGATINNSSNDDATAIQAAVNAASGAGGGIVYMPTGRYDIKSTFKLATNVKLLGQDSAGTILNVVAPFTTENAGLFSNGGMNMIMLENFKIKQNGIAVGDGTTTKFGSSQMVCIRGVTWDSRGIACFTTSDGGKDVYLQNSTFIGSDNSGATMLFDIVKQFFVTGCNIRMTMDAGAAILNKGVRETALIGNDIRDLDNTTTDGSGWGKGRIWSHEGSGGAGYNMYFGENLGYGLGIRVTGSNIPDANSGEIFLWEANEASFRGNISSATTTTITFTSSPGSLSRAKTVYITDGKGMGQFRRITAIGGNTITLDRPLLVVPDGNSKATIGPFCFNLNLWGNTLNANGKSYIAGNTWVTASAGVSWYGGGFHSEFTDNKIDGIRHGAAISAIAYGNSIVDGAFWNVIQNNQMTNTLYGVKIVANDNTTSGWNAGGFTNTAILGTSIRGNSILNTKTQTIMGSSWIADMVYCLTPHSYSLPYIHSTMIEYNTTTVVPLVIRNYPDNPQIFNQAVGNLPTGSTINTVQNNNN